MKLDGFMIVYNEEHLLPYAFACWEAILPVLGTLSIVDNGSTDATLEIVHIWTGRLPIVLQVEESHRHHGRLRNLALTKCTAPWIMYLDADETWTSDMLPWLTSPVPEQANQWQFYKYSTFGDREHYAHPGHGPSRRLFRNLPGVNFPQEIHTEPTHEGGGLGHIASTVHEGEIWWPLMFDHTGCKYPEELWAKGWRYQWARGVVGIGPIDEYIFRQADATARRETMIKEFSPEIKSKIFTGPMGGL